MHSHPNARLTPIGHEPLIGRHLDDSVLIKALTAAPSARKEVQSVWPIYQAAQQTRMQTRYDSTVQDTICQRNRLNIVESFTSHDPSRHFNPVWGQ